MSNKIATATGILVRSDYAGGVALELSPKNDDPVGGLREGNKGLGRVVD